MEGPVGIFSVDGEFSGPFSPEHYLVALGAVVVALDGTVVSKFKISLKPLNNKQGFDPITKKRFWDHEPNKTNLKNFTADAVEAKEGMKKFYAWLQEASLGRTIKMVTDSPTDICWVNYYLAFVADLPCLDMMYGSFGNQPNTVSLAYELAIGVIEDDDVTQKTVKKLKIDDPEAGNHMPDDDAEETALRFARFLNKVHSKKTIAKHSREPIEKKDE